MTQSELADKIQSSQPRIANAENADASVSIELLIRAILATGATVQQIGQVIESCWVIKLTTKGKKITCNILLVIRVEHF